MREIIVKRDELVFPDTPCDDERFDSILSADPKDLPPILVISKRGFAESAPFIRIPDYLKWIIVDGCRRAHAQTSERIPALKLTTNKDVAEARELISDLDHCIHREKIRSIKKLRQSLRSHFFHNVVGKKPWRYFRSNEFSGAGAIALCDTTNAR